MAGTRPENDKSSQEAARCTISLALHDGIRDDTRLWTKPRPLSLYFAPLPDLFQLPLNVGRLITIHFATKTGNRPLIIPIILYAYPGLENFAI